MDLQCPHQGAKNLMKTVFPAVSESQFSGVSSTATAFAMKPSSTNDRNMANQWSALSLH